MLCDKCQLKEATVFVTQICEGKSQQIRLCGLCAEPLIHTAQADAARFLGGDFGDPFSDQNTAQYLASLDPRFPPEAYLFVSRAAQAALPSSTAPEGHVTGPDIAEAFRQLALAEFGSQALVRLAEWNITSCDDIGAIVFLMVKHGIFGARPEDRPEDFHGVYDFPTAFPRETLI